MCVYDLVWLVFFLLIRNGRGSHQTLSYLISYYLILSYLILSYLILYHILLYSILSYLNLSYHTILCYIIRCYLCINMWCDTQRCWLNKNIYHYYSIIHWCQDGVTALYCAANGGHLEVVVLLLERGANIEATNNVS